MDFLALGVFIVGLYLVAYATYRAAKLRQLTNAALNTKLSYFLQKSPASKAAGRYVDSYLGGTDNLKISWRNKDGSGGIITSENMTDEDAFKMAMSEVDEIGERLGLKAAIIQR